jgi:hypothetical protein
MTLYFFCKSVNLCRHTRSKPSCNSAKGNTWSYRRPTRRSSGNVGHGKRHMQTSAPSYKCKPKTWQDSKLRNMRTHLTIALDQIWLAHPLAAAELSLQKRRSTISSAHRGHVMWPHRTATISIPSAGALVLFLSGLSSPWALLARLATSKRYPTRTIHTPLDATHFRAYRSQVIGPRICKTTLPHDIFSLAHVESDSLEFTFPKSLLIKI